MFGLGLINCIDAPYQAIRHAGCLLGRVTYLANNHKVTECDEFGKQYLRKYRDSVSEPRQSSQTKQQQNGQAACVQSSRKRKHESVLDKEGQQASQDHGQSTDNGSTVYEPEHRRCCASSLLSKRMRLEDERQARRTVEAPGPTYS